MEIAQDAVNDFLEKNKIVLTQNQFDALVSFTFQYGENWWTKTPEKKLPQFIREGNGIYEPEEVEEIFGLHDSPSRRAIEAEVFIYGYE